MHYLFANEVVPTPFSSALSVVGSDLTWNYTLCDPQIVILSLSDV